MADHLAPATVTEKSAADTLNATIAYLSLREAIALVNSATLPSGLSAPITGQSGGTLHGGEPLAAQERREDLRALDEALTRLAAADPQAARRAAAALGVSPRTVDRLWAFARVWLLRVAGGDAPDSQTA
jgi:hypothetical protein